MQTLRKAVGVFCGFGSMNWHASMKRGCSAGWAGFLVALESRVKMTV